MVSQQALQWGVASQHALQLGVGSRPTARGKLRGLATGGSPGPHPGGLQAHTLGGLQATPGGCVSQHALRQTPPWMATAVGSTHPTGMHSCLMFCF